MAEEPPFIIAVGDDAALEALDAVCTVSNAERILCGTFIAVMRAYEKGAKREPFVEILDNCTKLHDLMARIKFLNALKVLIEKQPVNPDDLAKSISVLTSQAESRRTKIIEQMQAVKKIPARGVTKH